MLKMRLNLQFFASGTITGSVATSSSNTKLQMKIVWSSVENVSENTSTVTTKLYGRRADSLSGATSERYWKGSVQVGSNTAHTFTDMGSSWANKEISTSWVLFKTYTDTVKHNSNGTKSVTISGYLIGPTGTTLSGVKSSGSGTATLGIIPVKRAKIKVNGQYTDGEIYIKKNSEWVTNLTLYRKVDDAWQEVV